MREKSRAKKRQKVNINGQRKIKEDEYKLTRELQVKTLRSCSRIFCCLFFTLSSPQPFIADPYGWSLMVNVRSHELTVIVTRHLRHVRTNKAKDQLQQLIKDLNFFIFLYGLEEFKSTLNSKVKKSVWKERICCKVI